MKNKKGFTLIELLAVIVILAIIALISTPIILGIIDSSKKSALRSSAYGLIDAAEVYYAGKVNTGLENPVSFDFVDGVQTSSEKLKYSGKIDTGKLILNTNGKMVLCISDGTYYAYKDLNEEEVASGEGICSYNGETGDFTIISDVDALNEQIANLQAEIDSMKSDLATVITEKGVMTSSTDSFETIMNNLSNIKVGRKITKLGNYPMASTASVFSSSTINLTSYANYKNLTVDDILVEATRIQLGTTYSSWISADNPGVGISLSKSYNANTGILTITAVGNNTAGTSIGFGFGNANWNSYFNIYVIE